METVCDYADFQAASDNNANWYRLEDSQKQYGMQAITNAMEKYLSSMNINVNYNSPVTSLAYVIAVRYNILSYDHRDSLTP
jgi:hypothetical protein